MTPQQLYQWLVELIGTWPETKVTMTWGEPHFRVGDKIFSGWGAHKDGRYSMGAKLDKDKQAALVASDPRFEVAPYVGKHGWVSFTPGDKPDLGEIEALLLESYRNVASKTQVARLDAGGGGSAGKTNKAGAAGKTQKAAPAKAVKASPARLEEEGKAKVKGKVAKAKVRKAKVGKAKVGKARPAKDGPGKATRGAKTKLVAASKTGAQKTQTKAKAKGKTSPRSKPATAARRSR